MTDTSKDLHLVYELANGKNHSMVIPDYKDGITNAQALAGAKGILSEGIFAPDGQEMVSLVSATRVDTVKTAIDVDEAA